METRVSQPYTSARDLAVEALLRTLRDKHPLDETLDHLLDQATKMAPRDKALAFQITVGSVRHLSWLDHLLTLVMPRPLPPEHAFVWCVLRTALFQALYLRVPARAAVHQAVDQVKHSQENGKAAFVNAVLRAALAMEWQKALARVADPIARLAVRHAHPEWLARRWAQRLDHNALEARLLAGNTPAPLTLRAHTPRCDQATLLEHLQQAGIGAMPCPHAPEGILLTEHHPIPTLPGYKEGWFAVQDEAAQLVGRMLAPQPGERILDACAAPGGKCAHIAALTGGAARILAVEKQGSRMARMKENLSRLGITGVETRVGDVTDPGLLKEELFDRILLDAPCSGTGVIRRHPDIKWRRTPEEPARMAATQERMLETLAERVRPGGVMVYAVCSLEPEEGERLVSRFLGKRPGWRRLPWDRAQEGDLPAITSKGDLSSEPARDNMDGFYAARMLRRV